MTKETKAKQPSKTNTVLEMLKEKDGVTIAKIAEVTGWQPHTVRGTLANFKSKKSLNIISERIDGERRYFLKETTDAKE